MRKIAGALAAFLMTCGLLAVPAVASSSSAQETACRLIPYTPYKHVRITGQKQVYGKGWFSCTGGRNALNIQVRLNKWYPDEKLWYVYGRTQTGYGDPAESMAYEWLCSNSGFGGSGSAYFATEARGVYFDYATQKTWTTSWKRSNYVWLSC